MLVFADEIKIHGNMMDVFGILLIPVPRDCV